MKIKRALALTLAVLALLTLCACGGAARSDGGYAAQNGYGAAKTESAYAPSAAYDAEEAMPAEAPVPAPESAAGGLAPSGGANAAPNAGDIAVDKIIYSANATVETTDFEGTLSKLDELIARYGGFVEQSSVSGSNYYTSSRGGVSYRSADYRIRIPSELFGELMGSLSELGNVPYSNIYTENITAQYYDVQARLTAYRTEEQSLLAMMEKAETVSDLLEIQSQLSEVRYNIESLQSRLTNWDRQVSYSTVYLSVQEVQEYTPEADPGFGEELGIALRRGFNGLVSILKGLALALLTALPTLLVLGAVTLLVLWIVRRCVRRGREKRAKALAAQPRSVPPRAPAPAAPAAPAHAAPSAPAPAKEDKSAAEDKAGED